MTVTALSTMGGKEGAIDIIDSSMDETLELQGVEPAVEIVVDAPSQANTIVAGTPVKLRDLNM